MLAHENQPQTKSCWNRVLKGSEGMRHVGVQNIITRMCALETAWQRMGLEQHKVTRGEQQSLSHKQILQCPVVLCSYHTAILPFGAPVYLCFVVKNSFLTLLFSSTQSFVSRLCQCFNNDDIKFEVYNASPNIPLVSHHREGVIIPISQMRKQRR